MKKGNFLIFIIGALLLFFVTTNVNSLQTFIIRNNIETKTIGSTKKIPKKNDLVGTYKVKNDKKAFLKLKEDGTYDLNINVCNDYLLLNGKYELMDTKLKLYNNNDLIYEDLNGNMELSFKIVDENILESLESLVCTEQETLFEK